LSILQIPTARVFKPLLGPSRYKGAYGGRGSAKSHFFADLAIDNLVQNPTHRGVCVREIQKSLKESAKRLLEDKIQTHKVGHLFNIMHDRIETTQGGVIIFQGMQDHKARALSCLGQPFASRVLSYGSAGTRASLQMRSINSLEVIRRRPALYALEQTTATTRGFRKS
jgi:hypothetical protein